MPAPSPAAWIGTSGWHYAHWSGRFYPENLSQSDWLSYYMTRFDTVEVNSSFYHLPTPAAFETWRRLTPPGFCFAVKAYRYITHMKKLKDPEQPVADFVERADGLGEKLGPVLFQLPPRWRVDVDRLADFLRLLPPGHRYAFEFRDESWFDPRVYTLLSHHNAALCIYHLAGKLSPKETTADFVYIRLHGPGLAYQGTYDTEALTAWAADIRQWQGTGREVFCYFDNDQNAFAVKDALALKALLP